jgi:hypothetical protein
LGVGNRPPVEGRFVIKGFVSHVVAFITSVVSLTLLPTVGYTFLLAMSLATQADMGGPLNLILVPAASFVGAAAITLLCSLITLLIQFARRRYSLALWIPSLLSFVLGAGLGVGLGALRGSSALPKCGALGSVLLGLIFNVYWIPFCATGALLSRLGARRGRRSTSSASSERSGRGSSAP